MKLARLLFGLLALGVACAQNAPDGYPVTLDGKTLWSVRFGFESETPEKRAANISDAIERVAANRRIKHR